jgi:ABC-type multidrug transport system fused ATPase/permease subunit
MAKVFGASYEIADLIIKKTSVEIVEDGTKTEGDGEVHLDDVKFSYPSKMDVPVLKGVTIEVKKNKIVAIVGASGKFITFCDSFYIRLR